MRCALRRTALCTPIGWLAPHPLGPCILPPLHQSFSGLWEHWGCEGLQLSSLLSTTSACFLHNGAFAWLPLLVCFVALIARPTGYPAGGPTSVLLLVSSALPPRFGKIGARLWALPGKRLFCSVGKLSCYLFYHFCHLLPFLYGAEHSCNLNVTIFVHSFIFEWGKFDTIH